MMIPFPGKATRELVIIDAPAHGLELFKRLSEIEIGDLRSGLRQRACGLFEESFRVLLRTVPEHGAAKADLELVHGNGAQRFRGESCNRGSKQSEVLDGASEKPHGVEGRGILLHALRAHFAVARFVSDAAAERCRTDHRSDRLGAEGERYHEISDRGGRAAGGTAGRMLRGCADSPSSPMEIDWQTRSSPSCPKAPRRPRG